jgi:outer membrane translocation and assembly module TamA
MLVAGLYEVADSIELTEDTTRPVVSADLLESRNMSISVYPYAYYTPEIDLAFGAGGVITFFTARDRLLRPSKVSLSGHYSTSKQYKMGISPQLYLFQNEVFISAGLYLADQIYYTPDVDNPEVDTKIWGVVSEVRVPALLRLGIRQLGLIVDYQNVKIKDKQEGTGEARPHTLGFGVAWIWDARDNIFYPTGGWHYVMRAVFFSREYGSDFDFSAYDIDFRRYLGVDAGNNRVIALQLRGKFVTGTPPFYRLPALGGSRIMRGYKSGVLRDRNYLSGQIEFRTSVWRRFGAVAFAGAGEVFEDFAAATLRDLKFSYGLGLRFKFNERDNVNLRSDFGIGQGTTGIYFGIEEAF